MQPPVLMMVSLVFVIVHYFRVTRMFMRHGADPFVRSQLPFYLKPTQRFERFCFWSILIFGGYMTLAASVHVIRREDIGLAALMACFWLVLRRFRNFLERQQRIYAGQDKPA